MKLTISAVLFVLFPFSSAYAAKGSTSLFTGSYACGNKVDTLQTRYVVTDEVAKGNGNGVIAKLMVTRASGASGQTGENQTGAFIDGEKFTSAKDVLAYCRRIGGAFGNLTVPAGTFATCKMSSTSKGWAMTTWIGRAPLGLVAFQGTNLKASKSGCHQTVVQKLNDFSF